MDSLLQKLYNGELRPNEQYQSLLTDYQVLQHYEGFAQKLQEISPLLEEEFRSILDSHLDAIEDEFSAAFQEGFRLGAQMMLEILKEQK